MKNIKIKVAEWELVASPKREENEEKSYEKGAEFDQICGCCGKVINNPKTAKELHLIEGGSYFTEYKETVNECEGADMGWWTVGPVCYKKFINNLKEIEIQNKD